jgi:hypothetical protein
LFGGLSAAAAQPGDSGRAAVGSALPLPPGCQLEEAPLPPQALAAAARRSSCGAASAWS